MANNIYDLNDYRKNNKTRKYKDPNNKGHILLILIVVSFLISFLWWYVKYKKSESGYDNAYIETAITEGGSNYHYHQLTADEKRVYNTIYYCCLKYQSEMMITPVKREDFQRALFAFRMDHPEFYWMNDSLSSYAIYGEIVNRISCNVPSDAEEKMEVLSKKADEILKDAPKDEYELVKYIYEYIIYNTEYDLNAPDNQTAYSALINKSSVCAGYSEAFLYLCDRAGINCGYVTGEIMGMYLHAWNFVKLGDHYYWVDVTWGDPGYEHYVDLNDNISYDYLCVPDDDIITYRTLSNNPSWIEYRPYMNFTYPVCDDDSLNYFKKARMNIESYDRESFKNSILSMASDTDKEMLILKFSSSDVYDQAVEDLFNTNNAWSDITKTLKKKYGIQLKYGDAYRINELCQFVIKIR